MSSTGRPMEEFSMAFVTAPTADKAKELASGIVSGKLAACVNIIPGITSVYEWQGKIEEDSEVLMMIKTRTTSIPELTEYVRKNHPYDVCEVITTSIEGGNQAYLDWIAKTVPEKCEK
ncbi:protein CutA homolog [Eurytemora carolleeae]|uniref:protein CutA homolog n=1 Tax=Eurytemora carolleeae TaxID=1294199 RepID=UPI000C75FE56|nr:protein CutA homolog [Eurytemora carolleeae]|eukprot:XP_023335834.1 protein CutA homolog [Eurytemora affinis]